MVFRTAPSSGFFSISIIQWNICAWAGMAAISLFSAMRTLVWNLGNEVTYLNITKCTRISININQWYNINSSILTLYLFNTITIKLTFDASHGLGKASTGEEYDNPNMLLLSLPSRSSLVGISISSLNPERCSSHYNTTI